MTAGLENLRSLVHENFLPALDRTAIILSRLRGLAQFHAARDDVGFTAAQAARAADAVAALVMAGHRVLLLVMEELDLFAAFSTWLRLTIDVLAGPGGGAAGGDSDELTEKEALLETDKVLAYIQNYLVESPLSVYLDGVATEDRDKAWAELEDGLHVLETLDRDIIKMERRVPYLTALPRVEFLVDYVGRKADGILGDIAESQKRSVRFGQETRLAVGGPVHRAAARMCAVPREVSASSIPISEIA